MNATFKTLLLLIGAGLAACDAEQAWSRGPSGGGGGGPSGGGSHGPSGSFSGGGSSYRGPSGGSSYRGPSGGSSYRGPSGGGSYHGPSSGSSYHGPSGGSSYRGSAGNFSSGGSHRSSPGNLSSGGSSLGNSSAGSGAHGGPTAHTSHGGTTAHSSHGGTTAHSGHSGSTGQTGHGGPSIYNLPNSGLPGRSLYGGHDLPNSQHSMQHKGAWSNGNAWWHQYDHDGHHGDHHPPYPYRPWYSPWIAGSFWYGDWWGAWPYYQYGYPYNDCVLYYAQPQPETTAYAAQETPPADDAAQKTASTDDDADSDAPADDSLGNTFLRGALKAFRGGDYAQALRLANHAAVETPRKAQPHELMALALFALKDYRGANIEAHAALSMAPPAAWSTLSAYYDDDTSDYETQLDALVAHINKDPNVADARFVLAYHDLMMGHKKEARDQLEFVVARVPQDQVAVKLLKHLGGNPPPPKTSAPAQPPAKPASERVL